MARSAEPWRKLRVGDKIRFVKMPSGIDQPGYVFHPSTRRLYRMLIARGTAARISEVDAWQLPWIRCRFRRPDGRWEHHFLAVNDDSWVRVKPRKK